MSPSEIVSRDETRNRDVNSTERWTLHKIAVTVPGLQKKKALDPQLQIKWERNLLAPGSTHAAKELCGRVSVSANLALRVLDLRHDVLAQQSAHRESPACERERPWVCA